MAEILEGAVEWRKVINTTTTEELVQFQFG